MKELAFRSFFFLKLFFKSFKILNFHSVTVRNPPCRYSVVLGVFSGDFLMGCRGKEGELRDLAVVRGPKTPVTEHLPKV